MFLFYTDFFLFSYFLLLLFFLFFLFQIVCLFSIPYVYSSEKVSTYECGFSPFSDAANILEVSFCIIAIVFLLFDIEVLFLLPWASTFSLTTKWGFFTMYMFFCLVSLGLYVEWYKGVLINVGG